MALKNLLVQVDGSRSAPARYEAAIRLAQQHGAHLAGLCLGVDQPIHPTVMGMVPPDFIEGQRQAIKDRAEMAASSFRVALEKAGLSGECRIVQGFAADAIDALAEHARHVDVAILGQPDPDEDSALGDAFIAEVVMACGRPIIAIPYVGVSATLGQRVLVAWDGGREATRAVNDALPILEKARSVSVLSVNPHISSDGRRDPGADISLHLARHAVNVEAARTITQETSIGHFILDTSVSDVILAEIADNSIDLLVMGAYGHSRLREWVLGGITRNLLAHMTVPVLMSH
jgi:nucleotide-binding universal stress UspA family protein